MVQASIAQRSSRFSVAKDDFRKWRWDEGEVPGFASLGAGQIVLKVARFAFTSNNITYARLGEPIGNTTISYWQFFPASDGWGTIPVWGIGEVIASRHPDVCLGESVYGFYPMATHVVLQPSIQGDAHFVDATPHRQALPPIYQDYLLIDRERRHDHMRANEYLVLRPAFSLSFCCEAFLRQEKYFGARRIIISSASSKAALGLAFMLAKNRLEEIEIWGLTSAANAELVSRRGCYDHVCPYDAVERLPSDAPALFIDIAGNSKLLCAVHHRLKDALVYSCLAGFTHWDAVPAAAPTLPGPAPVLFSTPAHMVMRRNEWGFYGYWERFTPAYHAFLAHTAGWLAIEHSNGRSGVERVYRKVLGGASSPDTGHVLSLAE